MKERERETCFILRVLTPYPYLSKFDKEILHFFLVHLPGIFELELICGQAEIKYNRLGI